MAIENVESIFNSDGSKCQNFIPTKEGGLKRAVIPVNGVLISYIEVWDDDLQLPFLRPIVSTLCIDRSLSDALAAGARALLPHVRPILLHSIKLREYGREES